MVEVLEVERAEGESSGAPIRKIELVWPGKDEPQRPVQDSDGSWSLQEVGPVRQLRGLAAIRPHGDGSGPLTGVLVSGDRLDSLRVLQRSVGHSVRLTYVDLPRVIVDDKEAAFRAAGDEVYSTWMSVTHSIIETVVSLLSPTGVLVVHTGDDEAAFVRLMCDELLGRSNHVASIVWQKRYAPLNMKGMREFTTAHDNLFVYARKMDSLPAVGLRTVPSGFKNKDEDPRGPWKAEHKGAATRRESTDFSTYVPPYRWAVVGGELPPGVWRVSPTSGVLWAEELRKSGAFSFEAEVSDSVGNTARRELTIHVEESGSPPAHVEVPWAFEEVQPNGRLRIVTETLPVGVRGEPYSAVILADGGEPFLDDPKRPTKPRYWEYAKSTLAKAYAEDAVDFGVRGDAIPKIKRYLRDESEVAIVNQTTWWPGRTSQGEVVAGYTQDATRHLKRLVEAGVIRSVPSTAKPEALLGRLLDIFTSEGDIVVEVGGDSGDLSAVATKRGRRWALVRADDTRSRRLTTECVIPRLEAIVSGVDEEVAARDEGVRLSLPYPGGGRFFTAHLGEWLAERNSLDDLVSLNADLDDATLRVAVLTANGFLPVDDSGLIDGIQLFGEEVAVFLPPGDFLSMDLMADFVSEIRPSGRRRLTVLYFRSDEELDLTKVPHAVACRRVPYQLGM